MSESVILCEGYYDRAFWAGWLEHLGCRDRGPTPKPTGGHYWFDTRAGNRIEVVPCKGKSNVLPAARLRISQRQVSPFARLVVCLDADTDVVQGGAETGLRNTDLLRVIRGYVPKAKLSADADIELADDTGVVSLVRWETGDAEVTGLPGRHCLERLVCAALVATYPDRGRAVADWLAVRPKPPASDPKEFAWSHMAGWYAKLGCDAFYRGLWADSDVVVELETRLKACNAWRVAEALTG